MIFTRNLPTLCSSNSNAPYSSAPDGTERIYRIFDVSYVPAPFPLQYSDLRKYLSVIFYATPNATEVH